MRVLLIEDDEKIAAFVAKGLREAGYAVDVAHDGERGFELGVENSYDAAVVDLTLPGVDGLTWIEKMRERGDATPVLILSAKHTVDDRIRGLQAGGDDYMTKPFSFSEVLARVQALIRRSTRATESTVLSFEDLEMDLLAHVVRRDGVALDLRPKEFALLEYLLRHQGRIVSKTAILENVYGYHFDPQTNVVDVLVHRLRSKVDKGFDQKLIHTVRGAGYVLRT